MVSKAFKEFVSDLRRYSVLEYKLNVIQRKLEEISEILEDDTTPVNSNLVLLLDMEEWLIEDKTDLEARIDFIERVLSKSKYTKDEILFCLDNDVNMDIEKYVNQKLMEEYVEDLISECK